MSTNVLNSYLVSLKYISDAPSLAAFNASLREAEAMATRTTGGMVKKFVEVGAAVAGMYAAVGTSTVAMLDKVASAELGYSLLGMRMYMSADAAKAMSIATKALGRDLNEVAWNPLLRAQYGQLVGDQAAMQRGLGPGYKKQVEEMQQIRFQFQRMKVEAEYFGMGLSKALMDNFGGAGLLDKLKSLNDWIITKLPEWSRSVAKYLTPVLQDGVQIGRDLWRIMQDLTSVFLSFVGALYNDEGLKKGVVSLENLGQAAKLLSGSLVKIFDTLTAIVDFLTAHQGMLKIAAGTGLGLALSGGNPIGGAVGLAAGTYWAATTGGGAAGAQGASVPDRQALQAMAQAAAVRHGIDPVTFMALIEKESAWNPNAKNPKSTAAGLGQLIAGTARDMGVQNVYDPYQNLEGSAKYLEHLVGLHHGNYARALASYGEGGSYASDVLARRSHYGAFQPSSVQGGPVSVGPITVHVMQPNASGDEIADKVAAKVGKETAFVTQRNLAELSGSYA